MKHWIGSHRWMLLLITILLIFPLAGSVAGQENDYEGTLESLGQHEVPEWYHDAKLGIFIHWGVYSVPAWAPLTGELDEVLEAEGWPYWFQHNPYAEWYANSMQIEGSDTYNYHVETYGEDFEYADFAPEFNSAISEWDPEAMAALFADVGARYVVLTTKHHDGFTLWPSEIPNPSRENWAAERDIVGELTEAVRAEGMRMGLYYSGGLDWTFKDIVIRDLPDLFVAIPQEQEYADYANAHWRELIDRYQPSILWNDLGYPAAGNMLDLMAYYYNTVPEGVINNRFNLDPAGENHYDFTTPEYAESEDILEEKWESTRGLGYSFGYNMNDSDENLLSVDDLVDSFVDIVSKNGNLLLNVGPMADGSISDVQMSRLTGLGNWLDVNGEAIFETRPWVRAEAVTSDGIEVRFTQKDDSLYAILLDTPASESVTIEGLTVDENATITLLGIDGDLEWTQGDDGLTITLPEGVEASEAHTLKITPMPEI